MSGEKQDRRIKKTKHSIKDALITLLSKKPITNITIKEICELADINRSTFYAHYRDQQELMDKIEGEVLEEFRKNSFDLETNQSNLFEKLKSVLEFVSENQKICLALIGIHGNKEILKEVLSYPQNKLYNDLIMNKNTDPSTLKYVSLYMVNANASVILEWMQTGMKKPIDELAELLLTLSLYGISQFGN